MRSHAIGAKFVRLLPLLCAAFGLPACGVLQIVDPPGTNSSGVIWADAPVTPLSVKLLDGYAGNFAATLDGAPIGGFAPAPAKNVTVSTPGPECFWGGSYITGTQAPARYQHDFSATADTDQPSITITSDTLLFVPPSLYVQPAGYVYLGLNQTRTMTMALVPGPTAPLQVTLVPNFPTISVNGRPAGQPATVTLPTNAAGTFSITGVSLGSFRIDIRARGVECSGTAGYVTRG